MRGWQVLGRRHFLPAAAGLGRRGDRASPVRIRSSRSDAAAVSSARVGAAHHQPTVALLLQGVTHLHALAVACAFRGDLHQSVGFVAVELERCHRDVHVLIAETGLGEMIQNALMDRFPILISAVATREG